MTSYTTPIRLPVPIPIHFSGLGFRPVQDLGFRVMKPHHTPLGLEAWHEERKGMTLITTSCPL